MARWWLCCYEVTCCKLDVTRSNPTRVYLCPMSCGECGEPRGIVVAGMDPWTPCHASTSPAPVADSPSKKKLIILQAKHYKIDFKIQKYGK